MLISQGLYKTKDFRLVNNIMHMTLEEELLEEINTAFKAIGINEDREWNDQFCSCDSSVGMNPCEFCAVYNTLLHMEKYLKETSEEDSDEC